jgi:succinate dehydrogenase / fumarate reductase flavoprotein subunit
MPVKPGQHYAMGGVETDENGETCVTGLYAAGECACASVHGANRLGGNALPELIVFGKRAGQHAAGRDLGTAQIETGQRGDYEVGEVDTPVQPGEVTGGEPGDVAADGGAAPDGGTAAELTPEECVDRAVTDERTRVDALMSRDGTNHATIRARVQKSMTRFVNVFREEEGLKQALRDIREAREAYQDVAVSDPSRTFNTDLIQTIETRNLLDIAEAITLGALVRDEFRGAHWRAEHQERKDDSWLKHTMLSWNDGTPEVWFRPVVLDGEEKTYEPKVRSY